LNFEQDPHRMLNARVLRFVAMPGRYGGRVPYEGEPSGTT
jgi:hypothetical protein